MVSLWGSKKNKNGENGEDSENGVNADSSPIQQPATTSRPVSSGRMSREPNERTRLLDGQHQLPPPRRDGYLHPDDPAVSPYNLWSVRAVRFFTFFFAALTFIWWVILLVSIFISPPGMNTPGSGFTDFSYTTLALGILLTVLVFFSVPSRAIRGSMAVVAVFLLVDMIIILAVKRIRHEESWIGIASSIWALLMSVWAIMTDRIVAWGKREEEERLTGRPETRRTLRQWLGVFTATTVDVVYIIIAFLLTSTLILRALDAGVEMEGSRYPVDSGKYSVHLSCYGDVTKDPDTGVRPPTMILEAGEVPSESQFEHWAYAAWQNRTVDRYCFWDRPGYAWSDNAPSPHSSGMSADALSEALARAGEKGPWISVSAGYGSTVARIWAARHPKEVVGMMLIDPLHEDLLYQMAGAGRGFSLWGWGIISPLGIRRLIGALFEGRTSEDRVYGTSVRQTGKFLKAQLQENLVADSLTKSEVSSSRAIMSGKLPLVVISSGIEVGKSKQWEAKQKDLADMSNNLVGWDVVTKAPHEVWRSDAGKEVMEKRLGELVDAGSELWLQMQMQMQKEES